MPDLYLPRDGRDVASFRLTDRPTDDPPKVQIEGDWRDLTVDEDDSDLFSIHVHGADCADPEPGSAEVVTDGAVLRVAVDKVIRKAGRIRITTR